MSELFPSLVDSLEARWFIPGPLAPEADAWFARLGPSLSPETRTDRYLIPTESDDLGLKVREGTIQAKQRTATLGLRPLAPDATARIEAWRKWTLGTAGDTPEAGWLDVVKTRRQRYITADPSTCALELSEIRARDSRWWSVCLEASGETLEARLAVLRDAAGRWLGGAPRLAPEASMGYPAWLRSVASGAEM